MAQNEGEHVEPVTPSSSVPSESGAPPAPPPAGGTGASESSAPVDGEAPRPRKRRRRRGKKKLDEAPAAQGSDSQPPGSRSKGAGADAEDRGKGGRGRKRPPAPRGRRDGARGRPGAPNHALDAVQGLSELAQTLLKAEGVDVLSTPRWVDVQLRIPLDARRDGKRSADAVVSQILERVAEVRAHEAALVPNAVFCFHSGSAGDHSRPEEARQVFEGYTSTGKPRFTDFVTMAIERKDQGIDDLLAGEDVVLAHITMGHVLRTQQLAEFGRGSAVYRILGQVDAGLFPVLTGQEKVAFSFQLLRGTTLEGKPRLRLHPVGAVDVMDLADPSVAQILTRFQQRLDEESLRLQGKTRNEGEVDEEGFVEPLLQELARQLSSRAKRKNRRTEHADERSRQQQRPTTKAYEDASAVGDNNLLWDDERETAIVLGPRGRVHVFSADARHVTSLSLTGTQVQKRRQGHRWRPAEPDERGEFRLHLARRMAVEAEGGEPDEPPPPTT